MPTVSFSFERVWLIAHATLREAVRQKFLNVLVILAFGLLAGVRFLRDFNFGASEAKFIADFGDGAIAFFGAILMVVATTQFFLGEIESRTALTLLAKAVWRTEFVLGKFLGVTALAGIFCFGMSATLAVVLGTAELGLDDTFTRIGAASWGGLLVAGWLQWLKLAMLGAGTLLVACFAQTQIYTVMLGFAIWVVCHLQRFAGESSSVWRPLQRLIRGVFPDFQLFSAGVDGALGATEILRLSLYAGMHVAVTGALAVYVFSRREF